MSGEPGIKVEKHRSVWHKDIKVNPKSLIASLGKAAINGAFLKWDDLAENGVDVLEALGLEAKSGEIAGLLVVRSLIQAMENLLKENKELLVNKPDNLKALYNELNSSLEQGELVIDQNFFQHPKDLPIVQGAKTGFAKWLEEFVEKKVEADNISNRLPAYFVFALNEQWRTRPQDYAALKEELDTPFTQASEREQGWLRYRAWLQKRVEEPMFLEAFSLKQVYVPLRAYYEREVECQPDQKLERGITEGRRYERVVVDLNGELESWLQEAKHSEILSFLNLEKCTLSVKDFYRANFFRSNLRNVIFVCSDIRLANLANTNLSQGNLFGARLERANLEGANLRFARLERASLEKANLEKANLEKANLEKANLEEANLQFARLEKANLEGANLKKANLRFARLEKANLEGANLQGAILDEANFQAANLNGANLEGTILEGKDIASLTGSSNQGSDES
jgi:uncharacterized protein YjbI with pentapeptide repeats